MKNSEKLKDSMRPGSVYRRQELDGFSTAVDRDLKKLVKSGAVRKLAYGLYYRPQKNARRDAPADERGLIQAFLKTDDFLMTSHNDFSDLGLGLARIHDDHLVYNHKRSGDFALGGRRFKFRIVPAFPKKSSKEYLLVDLLNNLRHAPGDAALVLQNLKSRLAEFDEDNLQKNLDRYGRPAAKAVIKRIARDRRAGTALRIIDKEDGRADLRYWLDKSPAERVGAVELLREQYYSLSGRKKLPRLVHAVQVMDRCA